MKDLNNEFEKLNDKIDGKVFFDESILTIYSTDASAYKERPLGVTYPKHEKDIQTIITFANENKIPLIPRTAGTSLAGQVVGKGLVVDVSKYMNKIIEIDPENKYATVQPGVIRDELNYHTKDKNLFFSPETSTANRAMIGGMVGNNSCGANSVVYGNSRDKLIEIEGYLSDGSFVKFDEKNYKEYQEIANKNDDSLESKIYKETLALLSKQEIKEEIKKEYPKSSIKRRNTGYAIDIFIKDTFIENENSKKSVNFCDIVAGSEGTLMLITKIKVSLDTIPSDVRGLVCVQFDNLYQSLKANTTALKYNPYAIELLDYHVLECTKSNIEQSKNSFFIKGEPKAVLIIDIGAKTETELMQKYETLVKDFKDQGLGYHYPIITGDDQEKVWSLRKAGLGLLSNVPGDAKPVPVIEDTAVDVYDLEHYIRDFNKILKKYNLSCVHYAHAGSGELHLRPIINLKTKEGNELFYTIAKEIATLVKKYKGSLSGEHGDGRLRGEFIPQMLGEKNYQTLKKVKNIWDPNNIFNPNKIVDTPSMRDHHRHEIGKETAEVNTIFSFEETMGYTRTAEQCNGSGDCRKLTFSGGIMCPSYRATKYEKNTTRARANVLREVLNNSNNGSNPFESDEIYDILDLCLSCKGCKKECPSNVDMAKLKSEALYQKYKSTGVPFKTKVIGSFTKMYKMGTVAPSLFNFFASLPITANMIKYVLGFAKERSLPLLSKKSVSNRIKTELKSAQPPLKKQKKKVYVFIDEFTRYTNVETGVVTWLLLTKLGYDVHEAPIYESGRNYYSKGLLDQGKECADNNVKVMSKLLEDGDVFVGIEPSTILSFRDEYPSIVDGSLQEKAIELKDKALLLEEFLVQEYDNGNIEQDWFVDSTQKIALHTHCHQKSLSSISFPRQCLSIPKNYSVSVIPSTCCGMAGSFGYEKAHYDLSMKIGGLSLFPYIKGAGDDTIVAATGVSCKHQIKDGTSRDTMHPAEVLLGALR